MAEHAEHQLQDDSSFACASCAYQEAGSLLPLLQWDFVLFVLQSAIHCFAKPFASSALFSRQDEAILRCFELLDFMSHSN